MLVLAREIQRKKKKRNLSNLISMTSTLTSTLISMTSTMTSTLFQWLQLWLQRWFQWLQLHHLRQNSAKGEASKPICHSSNSDRLGLKKGLCLLNLWWSAIVNTYLSLQQFWSNLGRRCSPPSPSASPQSSPPPPSRALQACDFVGYYVIYVTLSKMEVIYIIFLDVIMLLAPQAVL